MKSVIRVRTGRPFPYGATPANDGVNFALFSRHATGATLVIYARRDSTVPMHVITLDADRHRERWVWHVFVEGLDVGVWYTWRLDGPADRSCGDAFDPHRELLDPYARVVSAALWSREPTATAAATPPPSRSD